MKYKKLIALALGILFLASCYSLYHNEGIGVINVNVTEDTRQSARSHLYSRVPGLSGLRLQTLQSDRFNLRFSHIGNFYTETIYVEITSDIEDAVIYFTTDGSDPVRGLTSRHNRRYTEPVRIAAGDFNSPTVLKARVFLCDDVYSNILTHTYFVSADIYSRFDENIYIFLISSDPYNLFDHDNGILVPGRLREEWMAANPGNPNPNPPTPANFNVRGMASERPAFLQVINYRGELIISQAIGIRVRGGWSRQSRQQSLGLYARSKYDPVFDRFFYNFYRFFDDLGRGRTTIRGTDIPVDSQRMMVLRNGGNDRSNAHMREELSMTLLRQAGSLDYKGIAPAAMFLNGVYRGFFWLQNMYPVYYFLDNYGDVPRSSIQQLYWREEPNPARIDVDDEAFRAYSELVCLYNYMLYFAFQIYIQNRDWPHNNLRFWRFNGEGGELINRYYDGMFRMVPYDMEMAWGLNNQGFRDRRIQQILTSNFRSFGLLMRRPEMVEKFCNQMFDLINTVFRFENVYSAFNRLIALNDREIRFAISRGPSYSDIPNVNRLETQRRAILTFAENRAQYVIRDMYLTFGLANEIYNVRVTGKDGASVRLNTLTLDGAGTIESGYFTAHSVMLSADSPNFYHWLINGVRYYTPEVMLNSGKARNGDISAEVFLR